MWGPVIGYTDVGPVIDQAAQARLQAHLMNSTQLARDPNSGVHQIAAHAAIPQVTRKPSISPCAYTPSRADQLKTRNTLAPSCTWFGLGPGHAAPDGQPDGPDQRKRLWPDVWHPHAHGRRVLTAVQQPRRQCVRESGMTGAVVGAALWRDRGGAAPGPRRWSTYPLRFISEQVVSVNTTVAAEAMPPC